MEGFYSPETYNVWRSIGYLLRRASALMLSKAEAIFADSDVTLMQWVVLMHLRDGLATTAAGICRSAGHDSGALTRIIDQLEELGLLERRRSCEDRRVVELRLTDRGRAEAEMRLPAVVDCMNHALDGFTLAETETLIHLLIRVIARLAPPGEAELVRDAVLREAVS